MVQRRAARWILKIDFETQVTQFLNPLECILPTFKLTTMAS